MFKCNLLKLFMLSIVQDVTDLFGADLPVEGSEGGVFAWRDGPFLQALKAGHWVVFDEVSYYLYYTHLSIKYTKQFKNCNKNLIFIFVINIFGNQDQDLFYKFCFITIFFVFNLRNNYGQTSLLMLFNLEVSNTFSILFFLLEFVLPFVS